MLLDWVAQRQHWVSYRYQGGTLRHGLILQQIRFENAKVRVLADQAVVKLGWRALLAWRGRSAVLRQGEIRFHHAPGQHALLFERRLPGQAPIVLAFNLGGRALDVPLPDTLGGLSVLSGTPLPSAQLSPDGRCWHLPPHGAAAATR